MVIKRSVSKYLPDNNAATPAIMTEITADGPA